MTANKVRYVLLSGIIAHKHSSSIRTIITAMSYVFYYRFLTFLLRPDEI